MFVSIWCQNVREIEQTTHTHIHIKSHDCFHIVSCFLAKKSSHFSSKTSIIRELLAVLAPPCLCLSRVSCKYNHNSSHAAANLKLDFCLARALRARFPVVASRWPIQNLSPLGAALLLVIKSLHVHQHRRPKVKEEFLCHLASPHRQPWYLLLNTHTHSVRNIYTFTNTS